MTDLERLAELAMRVEGLTGPDRETDLNIACALDLRPEWLAKSVGHMWVDSSGRHPVIRWADERMGESTGNPSVDDPMKFTASIDSAMTLAPETCLVILKQLWASDGKREWYAIIQQYRDGLWVDQNDALHPNAAIALTAASLKALAAKSREVG